MSSRRRQKKGGRTTPRGTHPASSAGPHNEVDDGDEPDLIAGIRRRLRSGQPLDLLAEVSSLVAAMDPRSRSPFDRETQDFSLDQLIGTFADVDRLETTVLLAAIAELGLDDLQRARARRALLLRSHPLPDWLVDLGRTVVHRCVEMVHVLGDGDNVMIGVLLPDGHELTLVVYIDHNMGTLVKDAFVLPEPITDVEALMRRHAEPDTDWRDIDPADARARIVDAIEVAAMTWPPLESDTWPACRPLVEWATRRMPDGGTGYQRPEWPEDEMERLAEEFFTSAFGAPLDDGDHRSMLELLLRFATDYGPGDPLRWSPVSVEIFLTDWIPRKVLAPADLTAVIPELLRAFIRFAHDKRGLRAALTDETVDAVGHWEPEFQSALRSGGDYGPFDDGLQPWDIADYDEYRRQELRRAAGGAEALAALDDSPLPDEPFGWEGIPEDIHGRVGEVLAFIEERSDLLGVEWLTASRRLLARTAAGGPDAFRRKARTDITAAAICWIVGRTNELFSAPGMTAKQLLAEFGLGPSGPSQRATTLLKGAGIETTYGYNPMGGYALGVPDLLVSSRRRQLIAWRKKLA